MMRVTVRSGGNLVEVAAMVAMVARHRGRLRRPMVVMMMLGRRRGRHMMVVVYARGCGG